MAAPKRLQVQLQLPYNLEPRDHPRVRAYLERGYRIEQLQRVSDREVFITFSAPDPSSPDPTVR